METGPVAPRDIDQYIAGFSPEVAGDARLEEAISPFAGEKGNLRFPFDQPIPYDLIERIVKLRVKQNLAKAAARGKKER